MALQNILENQTFLRIGKPIRSISTMDFIKGVVKMAKIDEMYNILNLLALSNWSRDEYGIEWWKSLLESALKCPYVYHGPSLLRDRLHLVRGKLQRKSFMLQYRWHWSALVQRFKKIEIE